MEVISSARRLTFKIIFIALYSAILLWFSIFVYGIVYFLYIPAVAHVRPVYLQYDTACLGRICKYPSANVSLVKPGYHQLLTGGQKYAIEVTLEMPESEANRRQGMFMINLSMASETGAVLQNANRPAVLHYKSALFRTIYTIFFSPALLAGTFEEKQKLVVPLFENYVEDSYQPTHFAIVEIQARVSEIYSSSLQIHAQFTGLRYFMYYWPLFSAFMGVGSTFFMLCIITLLTWVRYVMISPTDEDDISDTAPRPMKAQRPTHVKPDPDKLEGIKEPLSEPSGVNGHHISPPQHAESGIEVIPAAEEHLGSQVPNFYEAESELVSSLRKRNL